MKTMKKVTSILLIFAIALSAIGLIPKKEVQAASQAASLFATAKGQVGTKERSAGSDDIVYNDAYYGKRVKNSYSGQYAWCAVFVWWCASKSGISTKVIPKTASANGMKNGLIKNGGIQHLKSSGYKPVKGDIVFFLTGGAIHHVGIVDYTKNNTVYYVDGNNTTTTPHGVHYSSCSLSAAKYWGAVTPKYASTAPTGYSISIDKTSVYDSELVKVTVKPYDSDISNIKLHFINPGGKTITTDLGKKTSEKFAVQGGFGTWKVYASVSNSAGTFKGSVGNGSLSFKVSKPKLRTPKNIGTDFYAVIKNNYTKTVLNDDGKNVSGKSYKGYRRQIWYFHRESDGSYTITNKRSKMNLNAYGARGLEGTNVCTYKPDGTSAEKWFIYKCGSGYVLLPKCSSSAVLDLDNYSAKEGTNIHLWTYNKSAAQIFSIEKYTRPSMALSTTQVSLDLAKTSTAKVKVSAKGTLPTFHFNYQCDNSSIAGATWDSSHMSENYAYLNLTAKKIGTTNYTVRLINANNEDSYQDTKVKVKVTCSHKYVTKTVAPTYQSEGYTLNTCSICKYSIKNRYTPKLTPSVTVEKDPAEEKKFTGTGAARADQDKKEEEPEKTEEPVIKEPAEELIQEPDYAIEEPESTGKPVDKEPAEELIQEPNHVMERPESTEKPVVKEPVEGPIQEPDYVIEKPDKEVEEVQKEEERGNEKEFIKNEGVDVRQTPAPSGKQEEPEAEEPDEDEEENNFWEDDEIPVIKKISGLKAKGVGRKKIQLTWKRGVDVTGYRIYRYNQKKHRYIKIATVRPGKVKYTDARRLVRNKRYKYKVTAFRMYQGIVYESKGALVSAKTKKR